MVSKPAPILLAAFVLFVSAARAFAGDVVHVVDSGGLFTADAATVAALEHRLVALESTSGIRVMLQFHAKSPTAEEDAVDGAYMKSLATSLGVEREGVLLVYFADDPDWRIWIGDNLTPRFSGKSGSVAELTANGAIHKAKEACLTSSVAKADAEFTSAPGASTVSRRVGLEANALLDSLVLKLGMR